MLSEMLFEKTENLIDGTAHSGQRRLWRGPTRRHGRRTDWYQQRDQLRSLMPVHVDSSLEDASCGHDPSLLPSLLVCFALSLRQEAFRAIMTGHLVERCQSRPRVTNQSHEAAARPETAVPIAERKGRALPPRAGRCGHGAVHPESPWPKTERMSATCPGTAPGCSLPVRPNSDAHDSHRHRLDVEKLRVGLLSARGRQSLGPVSGQFYRG